MIRIRTCAVVGGLLSVCVLSSGCGSQNANPLNRLPVSGSITLDGNPLDQGLIQFEPMAKGKDAVNASAAVSGGNFAVPAAGGLLPGTYRVAISSKPQAGATSSDPVKAMEEASKPQGAERIPAKYNADTELKAEVKSGGPNDFKFDLKSDK